jgi:pimeloyl-ACP methyl ester carboxylesterase
MADRSRRLETIQLADAEIVTCIDGEGPTLVMLPSYGRDGLADFDRVTDQVAAAGWRVLRPQPRGAAGSTGPMQGPDFKDLAGDVAGALRKLGGEPAVVLGHAFGNFLSRVTAVEHPDLVRGVILAAASAPPQEVPREINETPFIAGDLTRPEDERLAALRLAFFAPGHDPRPWLEGWYPETLAMQRRAIKGADAEPYWSAGSVPILEIIPRFDAFKPQAFWSELHDKLGARATTVVIDDAAHALFPEQPDRVAEAILQWAQKL